MVGLHLLKWCLLFPLLSVASGKTYRPFRCVQKIRSLASSITLKMNFAVHQKALNREKIIAGNPRLSVKQTEDRMRQRLQRLTSAASQALSRDLGIHIAIGALVFPRTDSSSNHLPGHRSRNFLSKNVGWRCTLGDSSNDSRIGWADMSKIHDWAVATQSINGKDPGLWVYVTSSCESNFAGSFGGLGHKKGARMSNTIYFISLFEPHARAWQKLLHELGHHLVGKHTFQKYGCLGWNENAPYGIMQYSWASYAGQLGRFYIGHENELCYALLHSLHQFQSANEYERKLGKVANNGGWYFTLSGVIYRYYSLPLDTMYTVVGKKTANWDPAWRQPQSSVPRRGIRRARNARGVGPGQMMMGCGGVFPDEQGVFPPHSTDDEQLPFADEQGGVFPDEQLEIPPHSPDDEQLPFPDEQGGVFPDEQSESPLAGAGDGE